ncbi:MAG: rRNA maturation RNase YbeY [Bacteroidota bacterium]
MSTKIANQDPTPTSAIQFFSEGINFHIEDEILLQRWILQVIEQYNHQLSFINYILCSDDYLYQINLTYLNHNTLTDIITFPYAESPNIESDIFISIDRVEDNAKTLGVDFQQEFHRVVIHGVLHLCGLLDKTPKQASNMREAEEKSLRLLAQLKSA